MALISSKSLKSAGAAVLIAAASAFAALLPYANPMPKVSTPYDSILLKTWDGIKKRNVDAYETGLVHRPKSDNPDDAVSEGVSYGMFLALYCNDQAYFNKIWNAGEKHMWNGGGNFYDWRVNKTGGKIGTGPASDADQDIALLLVFADKLVERGIWTAYTSEATKATYAVRAKSLLNTIRATMVVDGRFLLPGHWGDAPDRKNPGYFAPAFYRVFAEYDPDNKAAWEALVNGSYELIAKSPGYAKGLIPDWCTLGGATTGGAGYNAYFAGDALYRDAIRVYWRLGIDYLWYKEPRAKAFLDNAMAFLNLLGGPGHANFFDIE
ncbi:MAG: hypothetical protein LBH93_07420, partial [Chitinispirillales bacterium]|nr:hypothetical protein [Chitinispirillales bacterium]